jgi:hypothetical protein
MSNFSTPPAVPTGIAEIPSLRAGNAASAIFLFRIPNMPAASDPEKYSIDEMMERLKNRPAEDPLQDGELVTRADGSQAIRVRKRKRRSHQPHKEELRHTRRARMLQVSGALILILFAAFGAGAAIVFANSSPFRQKLVAKIATDSGAKVQLEQFRMNPTHANAGRLILEWPDGNVIRDLTVRNLKADIAPASFLGKSMTGEEVTGIEGTLTLRLPNPSEPKTLQPGQAAAQGAIRFENYAIPRFNVMVGDPAAPIIRMYQSEASFQARNASGRPQLLLNRGDLAIDGWPKLRMDRAHIEFRGAETDILGMRLRHETDNRGVFELSGTVSPYASDRPSTLAVQLESYLLSGITGPELGMLFSGERSTGLAGSEGTVKIAGRIDTLSSAKSNYLTFTPGPVPDTKLALAFRNSLTSHFELTGFPFLFGLARLLDDNWFEHPMFETDATGILRRENGVIALGELQFEQKGRMAMRGYLSMAANRTLSGTLEVGIAEPMVTTAANRRLNAMLGPAENGFRWMTLKISGTAAVPSDNFRELFEATAVTGIPASNDGIPTFEELTVPE